MKLGIRTPLCQDRRRKLKMPVAFVAVSNCATGECSGVSSICDSIDSLELGLTIWLLSYQLVLPPVKNNRDNLDI